MLSRILTAARLARRSSPQEPHKKDSRQGGRGPRKKKVDQVEHLQCQRHNSADLADSHHHEAGAPPEHVGSRQPERARRRPAPPLPTHLLETILGVGDERIAYTMDEPSSPR